MKVGAFVITKKPEERGDTWRECLDCMNSYADVVTHIEATEESWPKEFTWTDISKHFQRGYDETDADWVIHHDADFLFHERDFDLLRYILGNTDEPALSFWKYQFIMPDRYLIKSRLVLAVNKKLYGDKIKFDGGGEADLCQPSLYGQYLHPRRVREARMPFYNYEKLTKTKDQVMDDCGRMDRAYFRHFGEYQLSKDGSDQSAYDGYIKMLKGRLDSKPNKQIPLSAHPKFIQETIRNLTPDQFGYDGFGNLERNNYARD